MGMILHPYKVVVCLRDGICEESKVFRSHQWHPVQDVAGSKQFPCNLLEVFVEIIAIYCDREERLSFFEEIHGCITSLNCRLSYYNLCSFAKQWKSSKLMITI